MDARSLLQMLFLALALGASYAQDPSGSEIAFHGEPGSPVAAVNRFVEAPPLPLRVLDKPSCTAGSADPSAPCEQDPEYNNNVRELVNRFLATTSDPGLSVFLNDSLTPPPPPNGFTPRGGFNDLLGYSPACSSSEEVIFPQRAKTSQNEWVFVANQENVKQSVIFEMCYKKDEPCDIGMPNTGDVTTLCVQKFIYKRMLVVGTNSLEPEEVVMPSSCVCYISRNNFDTSSGRNLKPNKDRRNTFDIASRRGGTNTAESQPVDTVLPPGGSAIGFISQPPQHVNHNIRRTSGGFQLSQPLSKWKTLDGRCIDRN
ncbi:uncharacterized protein [Palaemon carinicauda]|uniref:uncharacterized protein isoform X2 n=1 Tax=Palaemon carinicauda TaxID=392227 RepID=UPI0035B62385